MKKKRTHCGVNKEIKGRKIFYKPFKVKSKKLYSPLHSSACNFRSCTKFTVIAEWLFKSCTITSNIIYIHFLFVCLTGPFDRVCLCVCVCVCVCVCACVFVFVCVFYKGRRYCWKKLEKTQENFNCSRYVLNSWKFDSVTTDKYPTGSTHMVACSYFIYFTFTQTFVVQE
jgi:hypothetical protein